MYITAGFCHDKDSTPKNIRIQLPKCSSQCLRSSTITKTIVGFSQNIDNISSNAGSLDGRSRPRLSELLTMWEFSLEQSLLTAKIRKGKSISTKAVLENGSSVNSAPFLPMPQYRIGRHGVHRNYDVLWRKR